MFALSIVDGVLLQTSMQRSAERGVRLSPSKVVQRNTQSPLLYLLCLGRSELSERSLFWMCTGEKSGSGLTAMDSMGWKCCNVFRLTDSVGFSAKVAVHGRTARTNHHNIVTVTTQGDQDWRKKRIMILRCGRKNAGRGAQLVHWPALRVAVDEVVCSNHSSVQAVRAAKPGVSYQIPS